MAAARLGLNWKRFLPAGRLKLPRWPQGDVAEAREEKCAECGLRVTTVYGAHCRRIVELWPTGAARPLCGGCLVQFRNSMTFPLDKVARMVYHVVRIKTRRTQGGRTQNGTNLKQFLKPIDRQSAATKAKNPHSKRIRPFGRNSKNLSAIDSSLDKAESTPEPKTWFRKALPGQSPNSECSDEALTPSSARPCGT